LLYLKVNWAINDHKLKTLKVNRFRPFGLFRGSTHFPIGEEKTPGRGYEN
jgi:hypothetical protein